MADEPRVVVKTVRGGDGSGLLWIMGWLFTIGYLHLPLIRALYAIVLWPYYMGVSFARV